MKNALRLPALVAPLLALTLHQLQAQWTALPLPVGAYISQNLVAHRGKVYAATFTGLQLQLAGTSDYIHWSLETSLPAPANFGAADVMADGERLYLFGQNFNQNAAAAYFSDDDAQTWTALPLPNADSLIRFVPLGDALLCVSASKVFRSTDGGGSWSLVMYASEKIWDAERTHDGTALIAGTKHVFRSTDGGASWGQRPAPYDATGQDFPHLTLYPTAQADFVESRTNSLSTLFRSTDGGLTWAAIDLETVNGTTDVFDLKSVGDTLWGAFLGTVAVSPDGGLHWQTRPSPDGTERLASIGDTVFAGGYFGFFKTYDSGRTWLSGNVGWTDFWGIPPFAFSADLIAPSSNRLFWSSPSGTFSTSNDGLEWKIEHGAENAFNQKFEHGDTVLLCGWGGLRSFDGGTSWEYLGQGQPFSSQWAFARAGGYLFAATWSNQSLLRSADWGSTWAPIANPVGFTDYIVGAGERLFLADFNGIRVSSNYGATFSPLNNGLGNNPNVSGLWSVGGEVFANVGGQLYRLAGNQWKPASAGLFDDMGNLPLLAGIVGDEALKLLFGTAPSGDVPQIFLSEDAGQTWQGNLADGLPNSSMLQATLHGNAVYATGQLENSFDIYIWKRAVTLGAPAPSRRTLSASIWPNPAASTAWLRLGQAPQTDIHVNVSDATGRLIWQSTLVGQPLRIPVERLVPGIYFVSLIGADGVCAQQKLLVRR
ncbi:MAG: T9SS type A sorting domain-containing protein [Saprospiraceae bacterium]